MLPASSAGQSLLSFAVPQVEEAAQTAARGLPAAPAGGAPLGPAAKGVPVDVDFALLRSGPPRLLVPAPDGTVLAVERTFFEDRGSGNATWAGRVAGSEAETVVLTLQDGHLAGTYGELGESAFELEAGPDGGGRVLAGSAAPPDGTAFCEAPEQPDPDLLAGRNEAWSVRALPASEPRLAAAFSTQTTTVDLLIVYDQAAESGLTARGRTVSATVKSLVDHANSVLRNNDLAASFNVAHTAKVRQFGSLSNVSRDDGVATLRALHDADLVIYLNWHLRGWCGRVLSLYWRSYTVEQMANVAFADVNLRCSRQGKTFVHEIGHLLGGLHGSDKPLTGVQRWPYVYSHRDTTPNPDVLTVMEAGNVGGLTYAPYFSTIRVTPNDWTLGVEDERDMERALRQTLLDAASFDSYIRPARPADLNGSADEHNGGGRVKLS